MTAVAVGSIVAPVIESTYGARTSLLIVGLILPVVALASGRWLRRIDTTLRSSDRLELVEAVPMFAPLSIAAKERVAASLAPVFVRRGRRLSAPESRGHLLHSRDRPARGRAGREAR